MSEKHVVVLGAGPGGYSAAFHAADSGFSVTLVDAEKKLGGVCLQKGCIPSKTLLHLAKLIHETREAKDWGLDFGEPSLDIDALRKWKDQVIQKMTLGLSQLARQRKVNVVQGRARFQNSHSIIVNDQTMNFDHCIIATGSRPVLPQAFQELASDGRVMDSTSALELESIPDRLLVVGGGYIGLEMGTVYSALGSSVTVVELTDGLLQGADRDLVRPLEFQLKKRFEKIHLNTKVLSIKGEGEGLQVQMESAGETTEESFDKVLLSVGRSPRSDDLGLESTQVEVDERGFIKVDSYLQTGDPAISAIGDVIGGAMLAHKASYEAHLAVSALLKEKRENRPVMPAVVFTDPEIAWCGLTETEAKAKGITVSVAKFPWGASGRAVSLGRPEGATKWIVDPETDTVLGMGVVGAGAGELIAEGVLAVQQRLRIADIAHAIHPHPTLSETVKEAAELYLGQSTHIYKRR